MEKRIYDKQTGIHYELQGDYYLPCLELPEQPKVEIGIWGKRHLKYPESVKLKQVKMQKDR